ARSWKTAPASPRSATRSIVARPTTGTRRPRSNGKRSSVAWSAPNAIDPVAAPTAVTKPSRPGPGPARSSPPNRAAQGVPVRGASSTRPEISRRARRGRGGGGASGGGGGARGGGGGGGGGGSGSGGTASSNTSGGINV